MAAAYLVCVEPASGQKKYGNPRPQTLRLNTLGCCRRACIQGQLRAFADIRRVQLFTTGVHIPSFLPANKLDEGIADTLPLPLPKDAKEREMPSLEITPPMYVAVTEVLERARFPELAETINSAQLEKFLRQGSAEAAGELAQQTKPFAQHGPDPFLFRTLLIFAVEAKSPATFEPPEKAPPFATNDVPITHEMNNFEAIL
ncbi:hypothetical protein C8R44DRAFT_736846 [Mycena epipterygia]|nr:hypothetical protein C8R44DRAFT_736846 [Mycena epipterygia]